MKTFKQFVLLIKENTQEQQSELISVSIGRFQPFHNGHKKMIDMMKYKPVILLVKGTDSSTNTSKNPFDELYQQKLIHLVFPGLKIITVKNANLKPIVYHLEKTGEFKVAEIMAGSDRISSYRNTLKNSVDPILFTETPRVTSATAVRESILNDDVKTFKKLMPKQLWSEWDEMRHRLTTLS